MTLFGGDTGWGYAWSREAGFAEVPGTRAPAPNGIELSADGEKIFLNATLASEVRRIDRRTGAVEARATVPHPDNSTWRSDGRLLVASLLVKPDQFAVCMHLESRPCPLPFQIVALDPQTLEAAVLYRGEGAPMGGGTVGLQVGDELFIGSFSGDRLLRVRLD